MAEAPSGGVKRLAETRVCPVATNKRLKTDTTGQALKAPVLGLGTSLPGLPHQDTDVPIAIHNIIPDIETAAGGLSLPNVQEAAAQQPATVEKVEHGTAPVVGATVQDNKHAEEICKLKTNGSAEVAAEGNQQAKLSEQQHDQAKQCEVASAADEKPAAPTIKQQARGQEELVTADEDDKQLQQHLISKLIAEKSRLQETSLTQQQLLERRLHRVQRLYQLYKVEYWGVLEEVRARRELLRKRESESTAGKEQASKTVAPAMEFKSLRSSLKEISTKGAAPAAADPLTAGAAAQPAPLRHSSEPCEDTSRVDEPTTGGPDGVAPAGPTSAPALPQHAEASMADVQHQPGKVQDAASYAGMDDIRGNGSDSEDTPTLEHFAHWADEHEGPLGCVEEDTLASWRKQFAMNLPTITQLEQSASCSASRRMDEHAALAVLVSRKGRYLCRRSSLCIGRSTRSRGDVDVDLGAEPTAHKLSRKQARIVLDPSGEFHMHNVGRKIVRVNAVEVLPGASALLPHLSLVSMSGVHLLFMVNLQAVQRVKSRAVKLTMAVAQA